jgi:hypothetical protein
MLKPIAEKLVDSGLSFLDKNVLGGISTIAKKALPTVKKVAEFAETIKGVADKVGALSDPASKANFQNIAAFAHAQHIF